MATAEQQRAWHAAHPRKRAEYMARWRAKHPDYDRRRNEGRRKVKTPSSLPGRGGRSNLDLTGQVFGRLTVLGRIFPTTLRRARWAARCECGNFTQVTSQIADNSVRWLSCGCLRREVARTPKQRAQRASSGKSGPEYRAWRNALKRCYRADSRQFKDYGGRGIRVCDEWRNDFPAFLAYIGARPPDVNEKGFPIYSLDRIDVDGNYEPGNVRWATAKEQTRNQRPRRAADLVAAQIRIAELERENAELRARLTAAA